MGFTFSKDERLCSRKQIDQLYSDGHRMMVYPYSVQWQSKKLVVESDMADTDRSRSPLVSRCQVLIVAPKKRFHHAVDRNRVKRLTRECWRHTKQQLYEFLAEHDLHLTLSLVYVGSEIMPYDKILGRMEKLVQQLQKEVVEQ